MSDESKGWFSQMLDWIREKLSGSEQAQRALLRVYRDSLLDNAQQPFRKYQAVIENGNTILSAEDAKKLQETQDSAIKTIAENLRDENKNLGFGELFRIESELWNYFSDETVKSRFWAVRNRFDRVVTTATVAAYEQSVPAKTDEKWQSAEFLRAQAQALIDTIQSNQLINLEREKFTNRLRRMVFGVGLVLVSFLVIIFKLQSTGTSHALLMNYAMLFFLGMLGACVSYVRRLQTAVNHNALAGDGLGELATIANNRITALSTLLLGGIFAILIYWLVLSQAFAALVPAGNPQPGLSTTADMMEPLLAGHRAELKTLRERLAAANAAKPQSAPEPAAPAGQPDAPSAPESPEQLERLIAEKEAEVRKLELDQVRIKSETASMLPTISKPTLACCDKQAGKDCEESMGAVGACVLGLGDSRSFYLMLVLAFLAGFAEQLVPDALNRLSRRFGSSS